MNTVCRLRVPDWSFVSCSLLSLNICDILLIPDQDIDIDTGHNRVGYSQGVTDTIYLSGLHETKLKIKDSAKNLPNMKSLTV